MHHKSPTSTLKQKKKHSRLISMNSSSRNPVSINSPKNNLSFGNMNSFTKIQQYLGTPELSLEATERKNNSLQQYTRQEICTRCEKNQPEIICKFCNHLQYCAECDQQVHSIGKFSLHMRDQLRDKQENKSLQSYEDSDQNNCLTIRISQIKQVKKYNDIRRSLNIVNIGQVWKSVRKSLQSQFEELVEGLMRKKSEIMIKVQRKQEQQILKYEELLAEHQKILEQVSDKANLKRPVIQEKLDTLQSKILDIENQYQIDEKNKQNRYTVTSTYFDELKAAISKMTLKNIISKNIFHSELLIPNKNKIKSSHMSSANISVNMSPGVKTPKNAGKSFVKNPTLSKSIVEDLQRKAEKLNQEEELGTRKDKNRTNTECQLSKVRSEKLFTGSKNMKSPTSAVSALNKITSYFKPNNKSNLTKKYNA